MRTATVSGFTINYPDERIFAFTPSFVEIIGTAIQQDFTIKYGAFEVVRFTGANSRVNIPLSGILQSFFNNVEFGEVAGAQSGKFSNAASKTYVRSSVKIFRGVMQILDMQFDNYWGALQSGQVEKTDAKLYRFGNLPLTVSQNAGNYVILRNAAGSNLAVETSTKGKDIDIQKVLATYSNLGIVDFMQTTSPSDIIKKRYRLISSTCTEGIYLRWIGLDGEYKYYLLKFGQNELMSKSGATYQKFLMSIEPTAGGLLKQKTQLKNKSIGEAITCGESSADDSITEHLSTLLHSIKQWLYMGNNQWLEVTVGDMKITKKRNEGSREISVTVVLPDYFTQSL
jgi:hypothetical protein